MPSRESSFDVKPGHTSYKDQSGSSSAEETRAIQRAGPGVDLAHLAQLHWRKTLCSLPSSAFYPLLPDGPGSPGAPFCKEQGRRRENMKTMGLMFHFQRPP